MTESQYTRKLCKLLREQCGARVFSLVGGSKQTDGIPDRHVSHPVWSGWLECKAVKGKLTKLQRETIRWLRACNEARGRGPGAWVLRFVDRSSVVIEDHDGREYTWWNWEDGPRVLLDTLAGLDEAYA